MVTRRRRRSLLLGSRLGAGVIVAVLVGLLVPATNDLYLVHLIDLAAVYAVVAMSLGLLIGVAGQISLAQAAFVGVGGYTTAILTTAHGWSFWASTAVALLAGVVAGLVLGIPALRLHGHYLGMVTLGAGQVFSIVLLNWVGVTGGANGIAGIPAAGFLGGDAVDDSRFLPLALTAAAAVFVLVELLGASRLGLRLRALRDDEVAAGSVGIVTARYKLLAFVLSSAIAAVAGSLLVSLLGEASPESFGITQSILFLAMVVLGGLGSPTGAIIGALVVTLLPEYLRGLDQWYQFAFGCGVVLLAMFLPGGVVALLEKAWRRLGGLRGGAVGAQQEAAAS